MVDLYINDVIQSHIDNCANCVSNRVHRRTDPFISSWSYGQNRVTNFTLCFLSQQHHHPFLNQLTTNHATKDISTSTLVQHQVARGHTWTKLPRQSTVHATHSTHISLKRVRLYSRNNLKVQDHDIWVAPQIHLQWADTQLKMLPTASTPVCHHKHQLKLMTYPLHDHERLTNKHVAYKWKFWFFTLHLMTKIKIVEKFDEPTKSFSM